MSRNSFPVVGGFYSDKPWSAEDTVNWLPVPTESQGTSTQYKLRAPPGMSLFSTIDSGPIRGMLDVNGTAYVVSNRSLYRMRKDGTATKLGTVPGTGMVSMSYGLADTGYQVLVANGTVGYLYDSGAKTFKRIADSAYPGAVVVDYINGYFIQIEPSKRYAFVSTAADGATYDAMDRFQAEGAPDRLVTLKVLGNEVWLFGQRTTEVWGATGDSTTKFSRLNGTVLDIGCAAANAVAKIDNGIFWLGDDGSFYRNNGYFQMRISSGAVEQAIADSQWSECVAFTWSSKGHKVIYWTFPDGKTFGYDCWTQQWHRRQTFGMDRWRVHCSMWWGGQWVVGDVSNGNIYALDWDTHTEDGKPLISSRTTGVVSGRGNYIFISGIELDFDTGNALPTEDAWMTCEDGSWLITEEGENLLVTDGLEAEATVQLSYSDDGGRNFSNIRYADLGAVGQYNKRVRFHRFGRTRNRIFRIQVSSPCVHDLLGGTIDINGATSNG